MKKFFEKVKQSPINYFSDLFIVAMVLLWIFDNVYESVIASAVTLSSVYISIKTGAACYDTSMWSQIGTNVAIPLSAGGAIWMIKNAAQHAIASKKGQVCTPDFLEYGEQGESEEELEESGEQEEVEND